MRIFIEKPFMHGCVSAKIYVIDDQGKDRYAVNLDEKGNLIQTLIPEAISCTVKPFLELPGNFYQLFIKAIMDHGNEIGLKSINENVLQGKLSATELHLDDMRAISKDLITAMIAKPKD